LRCLLRRAVDLFGDPRHAVWQARRRALYTIGVRLRPEAAMCGANRDEAMRLLAALEIATI
jgi:hypothetical protein